MFGHFSRRHDLPVTSLNEGVGGTLAGATWVGFGALAVGMTLPHVTWQIVAYAVLSLTLIRMVPVAIAMLGTGAQLPTVAFIGWFGPRGLASIVFALIALENDIPDKQMLLTTVVMIILLSVFLHGLSSVPLVAATAAGTRRTWRNTRAQPRRNRRSCPGCGITRRRRRLNRRSLNR